MVKKELPFSDRSNKREEIPVIVTRGDWKGSKDSLI
jgi:hypothetical protein